jgi:hypothetical protein
MHPPIWNPEIINRAKNIGKELNGLSTLIGGNNPEFEPEELQALDDLADFCEGFVSIYCGVKNDTKKK